jgi:flagellar capping protein FliD
MSVSATIKKVTLEFLHQEINERMDKLDTRIDKLDNKLDQAHQEFRQEFRQLYALLTQILLASGRTN